MIAAVSAAFSCTKEGVPELPSVIRIESEPLCASKIQLLNDSTVWMHNDGIGVFFEDGKAEKWTYLGEDYSRKGTLGGYTTHSLSENKTAVYPYSEKMAMSGRVISTSSDGNPILYGASANDELRFRYALSCICLNVRGSGRLSKVILKSNAGEAVSGDILLDVSRMSPTVSFVGAHSADSIVRPVELDLSPEEGQSVLFFIPSAVLSRGFTARYVFDDGRDFSHDFAVPLELVQGKMFVFEDTIERFTQEIWDYDFRYENILGLETSYPRGIYNADTGFPEGKTFRTSEGREMTFYTIDRDADGGTLGVKYNTAAPDSGEPFGWVQIGRAYSFIKLPAREGFRISAAVLNVRANAGSPFFSSTPDGFSSISPRFYHMDSGEDFTVCFPGLREGRPCYLMVYSKMSSFYRIQIIYEKKI